MAHGHIALETGLMENSPRNRRNARSYAPASILKGICRMLDSVPLRCVVCGATASRDNLCRLCFEDLPRMPNACARCALPLDAGTVCGPCIINPPLWQIMRCAAPYSTPCDTLISRLKFAGHKPVAPALAALLVETIETQPDPSPFAHLHDGACCVPDLIVPVPLHWRRLWQRGFNQTTLLAQHVSWHLDIPVAHALVRTRYTTAQTQLDHRQRPRNVRHAFRVTQPLTGRHIALIDDVVTTCATVTAAAVELNAAGAASVQVWACARAYKDSEALR